MSKKKEKIVSRNTRTAWTVEEIRFVEKNYGSLSVSAIGEHLGRTCASVRSMANRLECCAVCNLWSDEEVNVLLAYYTAGAAMDTLLEVLPRRTKLGIMAKVNALGIFRRRWSEEENRTLQKYYVPEGTRVAARLPGRTPSAIKNQAYALGLRRPGKVKWREDELILLAENQHLILSELQKLLPERSCQAIYHARAKLNNKSGR